MVLRVGVSGDQLAGYSFARGILSRMLLGCWLVLAATWVGAEAVVPNSPVAISVIAHPHTTVSVLSLQELRAVFSMRVRTWPDGTPIQVFVLAANHDVHSRFCRDVLRVYPYQLQKGWDRLVYTGTGRAPDIVADEHDMLERIRQQPGAIGYVALDPAAIVGDQPTALRIVEVAR
jgi:ABC-type phosphate transport system substrate-binding protein